MKQEVFSKQEAAEEPPTKKPYSQHRLQAQTKTEAQTQLKDTKAMVMPQNGKKKGLPRHFGAKNRWIKLNYVQTDKALMMLLSYTIWLYIINLLFMGTNCTLC